MQMPWRCPYLKDQSSSGVERAQYETGRNSEPSGSDHIPTSPQNPEQHKVVEHWRKKVDENVSSSDPPPDECHRRKKPCTKMDPMESDGSQEQRVQLAAETMAWE